jgi:hypothetical protein
MYQQTLLNLTIGNINVWQPMEYDLWISPENNYNLQIISDVLFYIANWNVPPNKIVLGLMPGVDDMGRILSLLDAQTMAGFAKTQKLAGLMIWDANNDGAGINNYEPYAYTKGIQSVISYNLETSKCCVFV